METEHDLAALAAKVRSFCEDREWDQFHGPEDLALGLTTEAAELLELFRFKNEKESAAMLSTPNARLSIEEELADVLFFLLRFAQRFDIDFASAFRRKMVRNAERCPVEKSCGRNTKYTGF